MLTPETRAKIGRLSLLVGLLSAFVFIIVLSFRAEARCTKAGGWWVRSPGAKAGHCMARARPAPGAVRAEGEVAEAPALSQSPPPR